MYKLEQKVIDLISTPAAFELYQSSFYMQMSAVANGLGFQTAKDFFWAESNEEKEHFRGWLDFVTDLGGSFAVGAVDTPEVKANSLYELVMDAVGIETAATEMYEKLSKELFDICPIAYRKCLEYIKIQEEALSYYLNLKDTLSGLDKTGELLVEKRMK